MNVLSYIKNLLPESRRSSTFLSSSDEIRKTLIFLPENIRYAMQYQGGQLDHNALQSLFSTRFGWCGWYGAMKWHANSLEQQQECLEIMLRSYHQPETVYSDLDAFHQQYTHLTHTIDAKKISLMSRYNFTGLDPQFKNIVFELNVSNQEPIILMYAGLFGLPTFLEHYSGNRIWLLNHKQERDNLFLLEKKDNQRMVDNTTTLIPHENHIFIDDITHTGKTHNLAQRAIHTLTGNNALTIPLIAAVNHSTIQTIE